MLCVGIGRAFQLESLVEFAGIRNPVAVQVFESLWSERLRRCVSKITELEAEAQQAKIEDEDQGHS